MRRLLALGMGCLVSVTASSEDLLTIFDQAVINDPQVREAEYTRKATREAKPQAWAAYLPQIGGRWTKEKDDVTRSSRAAVRRTRGPDQSGLGSPLSRCRARTDLASRTPKAGACSSTRASSTGASSWDSNRRVASWRRPTPTTASHSRIWRCAWPRAYFDVLAAQDNVQAQQASLDAISRQLEQADKRFEVGLIAITDVQEARAARDTAAADLIAAKRQLASTQEFLREITDMQYPALSTPRATMPLQDARTGGRERNGSRLRWSRTWRSPPAGSAPTSPATTCAWPSVATCRRWTWWWASRIRESNATQTFDPIPTATSPVAARTPHPTPTPTSPILLQVTVPIWSSGGTHSRVKQSEYRWQAAKQRLERVSRETERTARDAYLGVDSEISRVQALKQALESSRTALQGHRGRLRRRHAHRGRRARGTPEAGGRVHRVFAQPLRLHARRAAAQAGRRHTRSQARSRR